MSILTFGRHKGKDVEDVPSEYLQWMLDEIEAPPVGSAERDTHMNLMSEVEDELASRKKYGSHP
jgi:uncharacterized protein (DUF3820 family)